MNFFDKERMQKAIKSKVNYVPKCLSREGVRNLLIKTACSESKGM